MTPDVDYDSIFAATLPGVSFRMLMAWIADEDLDTDHIDAVKAFTQADIDRKVYVEMAEGFAIPGKVLLLRKALEGIKQGANLWFGLNRGAWLKLGFTSWMNEINLYVLPGHKIRSGVFADDVLVGFPSDKRSVWLAIKKEYAKIIRIGSYDTISPAVRFTGVQIERDRTHRLLTIHQSNYIDDLGEKYAGKFKPQETPHGVSKDDRAAFDKLVDITDVDPVDKTTYLQLLGKIVWPSAMT